MLLAGDIGGTKTRLALFPLENRSHRPVLQRSFPNDAFDDLESIVRAFLDQTEYDVKQAAFGVAGPVVSSRVKVTNLPWVVDAQNLRAFLGVDDVYLLNDLEAIASAVPLLAEEELLTLNVGKPVARGPIAVIAPGTGLGEAYLTWNGSKYHAHPSEGGHTAFGPTNDLELGLLCYLQERFDYVSYERICSGIGLPNIYAYLKQRNGASEPAWLHERLAGAGDPVPHIVAAALSEEDSCELCAQTLDLFVSILGAEAGNLALKVLATGGVYLGGGIPPKILKLLKQERFMRAFNNKGRFANVVGHMPVHVILNEKATLLGAAAYAWQHPNT